MVLTDNEILKWNDRLSQRPDHRSLFPVYDNYGNINISITKINKMGAVEYGVGDPILTFNFSFSVTKNRIGEFKKLFNRFMNEGFKTKVQFSQPTTQSRYSDLIEMKPDCEVIEFTETEHIVNNREFIRTNYVFNGKLTSIIAYVSIIEETIAFFEMIWGYDEDGNEYNLLKFPISSIVSLNEDKSQDYLVLDYQYNKDTNGVRTILLKIIEMIDSGKSVISYGKNMTLDESRLCYSRNNRIDNILN
jgi:hypothetical protein